MASEKALNRLESARRAGLALWDALVEMKKRHPKMDVPVEQAMNLSIKLADLASDLAEEGETCGGDASGA